MNLYEYLGSYPVDGVDPHGSVACDPVHGADIRVSASCWPCKMGRWLHRPSFVHRRRRPPKARVPRERRRRREVMPMPVPPRRPGPEPWPGWPMVGETRYCDLAIKAELIISSRNCLSGCRRLFAKTCSCTISGWYKKPPWSKSDMDKAGRTPKEHEQEGHGGIIKFWYDAIRMSVTDEISRGCMSFEKAQCLRDAFNDFVLWVELECEAENWRFDCDNYHPGELRDEVCNFARVAQNEANTQSGVMTAAYSKCADK